MKSKLNGKRISPPEVTDVSQFGIWVLFNRKEYFLSFEHFPWFEEGTIREIRNVNALSNKHLYWPDLDVDLHVESLEHPTHYPLVSSQRKARRAAA